ncbi:DUF3987 domain-containing protein [Paucihalobacter ruber]|uniref:DUF3987 domain-containing protein n=1 Tax=Paucihalobacter ruber TaxID=2567861 RepID=A0A506PEG5_9FLAO|nr:DUF3987 domain-containing protein [Paucihalobacter ruber]TPV31944.1 DUF3987 domain-containing protein [Paucihalobacter ruber]
MNSIYINFGKKIGETKIQDIFQSVKSGKFKNEILAIRTAIKEDNSSEADKLKSKLRAFTPSGTFGDQRKKECITSYSKIINLDFDHISLNEIENLVDVINNCEYTYGSFISPSGKGVKVFIKINSEQEFHTNAYLQVANFYKNLTGYDFDTKCKDITRLCFVSYDEKTYVNEDSTIFNVNPDFNNSIVIKDDNTTSSKNLDACLKFTEIKNQYYVGNRNNFIYQFACNANRRGILEEDTFNYCYDNFDLDEVEIKNTINSAYKNQIADFAKFANLANDTNHDLEGEKNEEFLLNTPLIPELVYKRLPNLLKEGSNAFTDKRSKDSFLTGALTIISGCLPNVYGIYGGRKVYPNLFSFIIAPAASGKGSLQSAKELADSYHKETVKSSLEAIEAYKREQENEFINDIEVESTPEPKFKVVFIPANTSNSKIIQHIQQNNGKGIICETEADTLGQTFKNDWGSYSDLLRKAFHHEKISISRKTNNEYFEIENPQLSVALSGTPNQIFKIISSVEDGLFSRFLFYIFKSKPEWIDPSPYGNSINLNDYFEQLSNLVHEMTLFFENNETEIKLSKEQWNKLNKAFKVYLKQVNTFISEDALSVVKRLGLILYRFCMIFTALRKFENKMLDNENVCTDEDFEVAMSLIKTYIQHSLIMFNNLPSKSDKSFFKTGSNKELFYNALPNEFGRKEAITLGPNFNLGQRSVDSILKKCLGIFLEQPKTGFYKKIDGNLNS